MSADAALGLYQGFLRGWNDRNAARIRALFATDAHIVGFDGSAVDGAANIEAHLAEIFAHHQTAAYVGIVREARLIAPGAALLRAAVGMVPPGGSDINPAVNAVQSLVAVDGGSGWRIVLLHTTPAAFHGRPEAAEALSAELRVAARAQGLIP